MGEKWTVDDLVQELFEQKLPELEGLSFKQVKDIVTASFLSLRKDIENGDIKVYRYAGFATFFMTENRAKKSKVHLEDALRKGTLSLKEYQRKMDIFNRFLARKKQQNEKQAKILAKRKLNQAKKGGVS